MYTRSYYPEEERLTVPENYDGTALRENTRREQNSDTERNPNEETRELRAPWDIPKEEAVPTLSETKKSIGAGLFDKLPIGKLLNTKDLFKGSLDKIGTEEILLVGVALFLLFSKNGDKECAIMLLLLLFVN